VPWLQLRVDSSRSLAPIVEQSLLASGCLAVTLEDNADQPIFEPELGETPLWQETRVTGLFEADIDTTQCLEHICQHFSEHSGSAFPEANWHALEDKDWEREWIQHYHPIQCGERLWICPSWTPPPDPNAVNLKLDPGLAFGTGTHPTTFLCLEWLSEQSLTRKQLMDYGCGSGILGIAGLLLGAKQVIGTDIDPQALVATRDNLERNGLTAEQFPVFFPNACPPMKVDVLMANILAGPLVELAPTLHSHLQPGGKLCLSGVLATQQAAIEDAYKGWLRIDEVRHKDAWICLIGTAK